MYQPCAEEDERHWLWHTFICRTKNYRLYGTFSGDDIWKALTQQAQIDGKLETGTTINEIAASWITKDRLPVLNVTRNYQKRTATLTQVP